MNYYDSIVIPVKARFLDRHGILITSLLVLDSVGVLLWSCFPQRRAIHFRTVHVRMARLSDFGKMSRMTAITRVSVGLADTQVNPD